jgi:hypothetical protein
MSIFANITHPKKRAFLAAYAACGLVTNAAKAAGISRELHYDWLAADARYAETFRGKATDLAGDSLEEEGRRRAHRGVRELVLWQGTVVTVPVFERVTGLPVMVDQVNPETGEVRRVQKHKPLWKRKYSDSLMQTFLKAKRPEFRDKTEHSGKDGAPIAIAIKFV